MHFHIPVNIVLAIQYGWHQDSLLVHLKVECLAFPTIVFQAGFLFAVHRSNL